MGGSGEETAAGHGADDGRRADDGREAVTGAGTGEAAFPVGALAGAAIGGVGGALVGNETAATRDRGRHRGEDGDADPGNPEPGGAGHR